MMERIAEASPRFKARMAGTCQLLEALTATCGQVIILDRLVVAGNAAATAVNILGHERLFWLGFEQDALFTGSVRHSRGMRYAGPYQLLVPRPFADPARR
jgi:hypothetical protein